MGCVNNGQPGKPVRTTPDMLKDEGLYSTSAALVLLLVFLTVLLYNLGGWGVLETSEARYAEISRELLLSKDWLHPRLLGIQHFHKPPLTYMISAAGMALFGIGEFGARFFLQVSLVLQAFLVYQIALELYKEKRMAFTAMVIYITIPAVLLSARNLTTDSFLTTFELLAIWAWIRYTVVPKAGWLYLFYTSLALAFLTKGPVGLIFPLLLVVGYRAKGHFTSRSNIPHHVASLLLFFILGASWYGYLMWQDQRFVDYFLFKHTVQRYANPATFGRSQPWWFYLVLAPALSLPWSAVALLNLRRLKTLPGQLRRLFICWLLVPLLFFSLSGSKLILYILPLFSGLALLVTWVLHTLPSPAVRRVLIASFAYFGVLAVVLTLAPLLPFGLNIPVWVLAFPLLTLGSLFMIWRRRRIGELTWLLFMPLIFTVFLVLYATHLMGANPDLVNSTANLAGVLREERMQGKTVVVYDQLLPSLAFALNRSLITIHDDSKSLERETQFEADEAWRDNLLQLSRPEDLARLPRILNGNTVLVVKGDLPAEKLWLKGSFEHSVKVGKWVLYY